jgi:hypothetical protein
MQTLGDIGHVECHFSPFGDRCTVCAKRTVGSEIILNTPDGTPRYEAQVDDHFGLFGDSANLMQNRCTVCVERTIGSKIILDTPDRTPR